MTRTQQSLWFAGACAVGGAVLKRAVRARRAVSFHGSTVVITGGSRGLGLLVARQLAAEGARLTIAARDGAELQHARDDLARYGGDVEIVICDVTNPMEAEALIGGAVDRTGRLDLVINNAGVIKVGPLDHMTDEDYHEALAVHMWAPLFTMRAAIPVMRRQKGGRIVNVSSIGGKIGVPHLAPYCASKFALAGLSASFRAELSRDGIYVTSVFPGLMRTGSPFNAWFKGRYRDEFTWFTLADSLPGLTISAERAAAQLIDACRHGDAELVISLPAKIGALAAQLAPETTTAALALANDRVLPDRDPAAGDEAHIGWQSRSSWAPSKLTRLTEKAAARNNEVPH
jgi:NAD(P)-dependent dehydrogenase (short-subunit alcohol dehydrogenase family)